MNGSLGCCTPFICHITPLHPILRVGPPLEDVPDSHERSCCPCRVPICMLGGSTYNTQGNSSNKQGEPNNAHQQRLGCWRHTALTCSLNTCFVIIHYVLNIYWAPGSLHPSLKNSALYSRSGPTWPPDSRISLWQTLPESVEGCEPPSSEHVQASLGSCMPPALGRQWWCPRSRRASAQLSSKRPVTHMY